VATTDTMLRTARIGPDTTGTTTIPPSTPIQQLTLTTVKIKGPIAKSHAPREKEDHKDTGLSLVLIVIVVMVPIVLIIVIIMIGLVESCEILWLRQPSQDLFSPRVANQLYPFTTASGLIQSLSVQFVRQL